MEDVIIDGYVYRRAVEGEEGVLFTWMFFNERHPKRNCKLYPVRTARQGEQNNAFRLQRIHFPI